MYEQRFGLHRKPFQTVTKAQDFFASSSFNELLPSVVHALQTDLGVAVLTGPAGVGKSVSLEQIQRNLESTAQTLLLRGGSVKGSADLLYLLHRRLLKLQPDGAATHDSSATEIVRRYEVVERLERVASFWGPLTILLDDAQLVSQDVFSELRSLLEEGHDGRRFARLLIAGPLLLEEVLAESANSHFARKIRTHSFLQPLRSDEAIQYLDHHFSMAGGQLTAVFAPNALELIVAAADGVPQCLNLLADESLMVCEETDCNQVTRDSVTQALTRLQHLPYSWNVSMVAEAVDEDFDDDDFGTAARTTVSDHSIEIGEFPSDTFSDSSSSFVTSEMTEGVFEIGAPSSVTKAAAEPAEAEIGAIETCVTENVAVSEQPVAAMPQLEVVSDIQDESVVQVQSLFASPELQDAEVQYVEIETALPESDFQAGVEISVDEFAALENQMPCVSDQSSQSNCTLNAEAGDLAEFIDCEDEDGNSNVVVPDVSDSISSYKPWAPAGQWPVAPVTIDAGHESELVAGELGSSIDPELAEIEAIDSQSSEHQINEAELVEPIWDTVATPVVDRFTWAELGRTSSSDVIESADRFLGLSDHDSAAQFAAAWPPMTSGVAPASQIPVSELDDEYSELLHDLGLLIDATAERGTDQDLIPIESQVLTSADDMASITPVELLASSKGPEGTIEELQQLIQEEQQLDQITGAEDQFSQMQSQNDIALTLQDTANSDVEAEQRSTDSHAPMASPRFFSMSQAQIDEVDHSLCDDSLGGGSGSSDSQSDGAISSGGAVDFPADGGSISPDGDDPDVVAFQQIVEERDEWLEQETLLSQIVSDEQTDKEQATPTVLRQARRQKHRSVLTMGLRQAAGAETVSDISAASADARLEDLAELPEKRDRPISLPMPVAKSAVVDGEVVSGSTVSDIPDEGSEKAGFSNLFTRLRRRRGNAS